MRTVRALWIAGMAAMLSTGAQAQSTQDWQFQITPYAWMSGLSGDVGTIPGLPAGSVDLSFGDILDDLEFAGMLTATARNGPWVIYLDTTYARTSSTERLGGIVLDRVKVDSETTTFALAAGRVLAETPRGSVNTYLGARAWWLENTFDLRSVLGERRKRTEDADWVDPLIGIAGRLRTSEEWTLFGALEAGGFGIGADSEWSVIAGATYHFNDTFGLSFGWRHLEVDYDKDGVLFDVRQSGPVLGATFRF